jgi:hypothetical protein
MRISNVDRSLNFFGVARSLLIAAALFAIPFTLSIAPVASAQVLLSVTVAPPALPVYTQPICPEAGYIWTPGYWSYSDDGGYFWVPGTWVEPPTVGFLWTPGYWGWNSGAYIWNAGYWGPQVGFYGGINYGFGYSGIGYAGGYWRGSNFFYNSRVNNVNVAIVHHVYQRNVVIHNTHVSYNGGRGGVTARPTAAQERFAREHHTGPTAAQEQHVSAARSDRNQFASANHGRPAVRATERPGEFKSAKVVPAKASSSDRLTTTRTEPRPAAKPRSETTARTTSKPRTEPTTESRTRTETKPLAKSEPKSETKSEPKAEPKPRTESKPVAAHESKASTPRAESATTHERKSEPKPKTETKPAATHESKPEAKSEAKSEPAPKRTTTHEPKPEAKPKTEPKPTAAHESKPEPKPRTESKPAAAHEPKPEAKPQSEPKPATVHESKPPAQHEAAAPREEKSPKR